MVKKSVVLGVLFVWMLLVWSAAAADRNRARGREGLWIVAPQAKAEVEMVKVDVEFIASPPVPEDHMPVLFIQDPSLNWWPYTDSLPNPDRTRWNRLVQVGQDSCRGRWFSMQVLSFSREEINAGLGGGKVFLSGRKEIDNGIYQTVLVPASRARSQVVRVQRR